MQSSWSAVRTAAHAFLDVSLHGYVYLMGCLTCISIFSKLKQEKTEITSVDAIFGGQLVSRVRCHACDTVSTMHQACSGLSLDVDAVSTLDQALENFIALDTVQEYACSKCQTAMFASKQMMLHRPPMILHLHLKRFTFDAASGRMRKVNRHVQFPAILNLTPYILDPHDACVRYRLYAVVMHVGKSCYKGHYFAYVRSSRQNWFCMDDEEVYQSFLFSKASIFIFMLHVSRFDRLQRSTCITNEPIFCSTRACYRRILPRNMPKAPTRKATTPYEITSLDKFLKQDHHGQVCPDSFSYIPSCIPTEVSVHGT